MKLSELKKDQTATIVSIDASSALKKRLYSFGLIRGAVVKIAECSIGCKTLQLDIEGQKVALRFEEAQTIEVEPLACESLEGS